jgi:hypothetical protein
MKSLCSLVALASLSSFFMISCGMPNDQRSVAGQALNRYSSPLVGAEVVKIINKHCISCHSADNASGGLDLTDSTVLMENGAAVVAAVESGLMPKGGQVTAEEIEILKAWKAANFPSEQVTADKASKDQDSKGKDTPAGKGGKPTDPSKPTKPTKPTKPKDPKHPEEPCEDDKPAQNDCPSQSDCKPTKSHN